MTACWFVWRRVNEIERPQNVFSHMGFATPCKHIIIKSFWCLESGLTSQLLGALFISPQKNALILQNLKCSLSQPYMFYCWWFISSQLAATNHQRALMVTPVFFVFLSLSLESLSGDIFISLCVCHPFHFMAGLLSLSHQSTPTFHRLHASVLSFQWIRIILHSRGHRMCCRFFLFLRWKRFFGLVIK